MLCGLAKFVTQAQFGTDECPTSDTTADVLRGMSFSRRSWQKCRLQSLRQRFEKTQTTTIISRVAPGNWCDRYDLFNGRWVVAQRGLWSIIERRYRERSVKTKEKVHDELEEKKERTTAIEGFLLAVEV